MNVTVMDFESTGLNTDTDVPVTLGYLTMDKTLTEVRDSGLLYFYDEDRVSSPEAEAIHGISRGTLYEHKDELSENKRKLFSILSRGILIGHNITGYDYPLGHSYLCRNGYANYDPQKGSTFAQILPATLYDTVKIYRPVFKAEYAAGLIQEKASLKLKQVTEKIGLDEDTLSFMHEQYFGKPPERLWHGATFDVTATALLARHALMKGYFII